MPSLTRRSRRLARRPLAPWGIATPSPPSSCSPASGSCVRPRRCCGPHPALGRAELADLGGHDTALRFIRRWKTLPSRYSVSGPESRSAQPLRAQSCASGQRSAMASGPAGRVSSGPMLPRPSVAIASLDERLGGRCSCRLPAPVDGGHNAGGRPVAGAESLERLAATPARVRTRPVVRRRQPAIAGAPVSTWRQAPARSSSGPRSRRGGMRCSMRTRRPCRSAAACTRRSHGTRRRTAP